MSYATIDDIFQRYSPIHTVVGSADNMVDSLHVSSVFIADAESLVDGFISRRYEVPLSPVPNFITQITSDIAIFNILVEKGAKGTDGRCEQRIDAAHTISHCGGHGDGHGGQVRAVDA